MQTVEVIPHQASWAAAFAAEAAQIRAALNPLKVRLHHIGSTAIIGIHAKPIIDMLLEASDLGALNAQACALTSLGFEALGEFGIPGRSYFRKNNADRVRTHHLHAFAQGSEHARRHLAFRDYLNAHPLAAQNYSDLKIKLAQAHPQDMNAYMDGKDAFVKAHEALALTWVATVHPQ
jgi:GrpB-like predicted nucleotidyltransferase (UPF0157 family)